MALLKKNGQWLENVYRAHLILAKWQAGTTNKFNCSKNVLVMFSLPMSVGITLFPFIKCPFIVQSYTACLFAQRNMFKLLLTIEGCE